jgi:hypothetical protein
MRCRRSGRFFAVATPDPQRGRPGGSIGRRCADPKAQRRAESRIARAPLGAVPAHHPPRPQRREEREAPGADQAPAARARPESRQQARTVRHGPAAATAAPFDDRAVHLASCSRWSESGALISPSPTRAGMRRSRRGSRRHGRKGRQGGQRLRRPGRRRGVAEDRLELIAREAGRAARRGVFRS